MCTSNLKRLFWKTKLHPTFVTVSSGLCFFTNHLPSQCSHFLSMHRRERSSCKQGRGQKQNGNETYYSSNCLSFLPATYIPRPLWPNWIGLSWVGTSQHHCQAAMNTGVQSATRWEGGGGTTCNVNWAWRIHHAVMAVHRYCTSNLIKLPWKTKLHPTFVTVSSGSYSLANHLPAQCSHFLLMQRREWPSCSRARGNGRKGRSINGRKNLLFIRLFFSSSCNVHILISYGLTGVVLLE